MEEYISEIIAAVFGFLSGCAISIPITLKIVKNNTQVSQSGNHAGRDIAGRDINRN